MFTKAQDVEDGCQGQGEEGAEEEEDEEYCTCLATSTSISWLVLSSIYLCMPRK